MREHVTQPPDAFTDHRGPAALEDACLLRRDLLEGVAQVLHVVPSDGRYAGRDGIHDVGAVQPATKSGLDERDVHVCPREGVQRHRSVHLEERRAELLDVAHPSVHELHDRLRLDRHAIHEDTLTKVHQVRRRVLPDAKSSGAQQRFGGGERAAFSVRASDVDDGIGAVRITELREQRHSALQPETHATGRAGEKKPERIF